MCVMCCAYDVRLARMMCVVMFEPLLCASREGLEDGLVEEGEDEKDAANDEAADGRSEGVGSQALLNHAKAADGYRAHEEPGAAEGVGAHSHVLKFELAHQEHRRRLGIHVEVPREDSLQRKEREGKGAHLYEEAPNAHDNVGSLHKVDPLVTGPVHGWVGGRHAGDGSSADHQRQCEEGEQQAFDVVGAVVLHGPERHHVPAAIDITRT